MARDTHAHRARRCTISGRILHQLTQTTRGRGRETSATPLVYRSWRKAVYWNCSETCTHWRVRHAKPELLESITPHFVNAMNASETLDDALKNCRVLVPVTHPLGGIRTYMLYNFRPLAKAGVRFTFLAPAGEAFDEFARNVADWDGCECLPLRRGESMARRVMTEVRTGRYKIVHAQGLRAGTEAAICRLFGSRVPLVITLHDVIVPGNEIPGRFKWLKRYLIGFLTRRASVIVPVSDDCRDNHFTLFPEWKRGPCSISVIHNGIDVATMLAEQHARSAEIATAMPLRQSLGISPTAVVGGFFGRFMPQKGFKFLIDAAAILAESGQKDGFRFVVTSDPHGYRGETIEAVRADPRVASMFHFIEPQDNIVSTLSQVDFLVMPSLWEACGLLAMEAMVLGVPVIGSDAIGLREVVRDTPARTPPSGNAAALAAAMQEFRTNQKHDCEQAILFATEAQKRFDVGKSAAQLAEIYTALFTNAAAP
ncbi:MAG: glycosyltransferase family 4 protein [Thermoguttaceae bacterium]